MKVEPPFLDEISGLGIIKLLALNTYDTLTMNINFERNKAFMEAMNDCSEVLTLDPSNFSTNCKILLNNGAIEGFMSKQ